MAPGGIGQPLLQSSVAGQQQQAFAIGIQPPRCIDTGNLDVIGQATPATALFGGELTENAVGLVEQEGGQGLGGLASLPEIHNPDRDHQQTEIHRNGGENHAGCQNNREPRP